MLHSGHDTENERQERAEQVADKHFAHVTPEFCEWLDDYVSGNGVSIFAHIVSNIVTGDAHDKAEAHRLAAQIQRDFTDFVANARDYSPWPMARKIAEEAD